MKCWIVFAPCAFAMASCAINAASGRESIEHSILLFEKDIKLPDSALKIEKYARFYKVIYIAPSNVSKNSVSVVQFRYIHRNMRPGIYIISDQNEIPDDPLTDGGCLLIDGFFKLSDGKLISVECAAQR